MQSASHRPTRTGEELAGPGVAMLGPARVPGLELCVPGPILALPPEGCGQRPAFFRLPAFHTSHVYVRADAKGPPNVKARTRETGDL